MNPTNFLNKISFYFDYDNLSVLDNFSITEKIIRCVFSYDLNGAIWFKTKNINFLYIFDNPKDFSIIKRKIENTKEINFIDDNFYILYKTKVEIV